MPRSFESHYLKNQTVSHDTLKLIRLLGEFRGKEDLYRIQSPQTLETLKQNAVIQSTESSNRIEGVTVSNPKRLKEIVEHRAEPSNRSEQEIAGYRDVLNTIHGQNTDMPFTSNLVLQMHRDLFKYTTEQGGVWKSSDNTITEVRPDGQKRLRFQPTPAWQTPALMQDLHALYNESDAEPLLAIPAYVLDFLCIHPFRDGNGRMARLLSLLMLYHAGFAVGRYISLEKIIEDTKETYYEALYKSSQGWHERKHNLTPWSEYFLGVMLLTAYREFEKRVGLVETSKGAKGAMVVAAIQRLPRSFTIAEVAAQCPTVGIDHIRKVLRAERDAGRLRVEGRGPNTSWLRL